MDDPISAKCLLVLQRGLTPSICESFVEVRRYATCRAWQIFEEEDMRSWSEAMRKAWAEVRAKCPQYGGV